MKLFDLVMFLLDGGYNKDIMILKVDKFYLAGRLTDVEFMEITEFINPTE